MSYEKKTHFVVCPAHAHAALALMLMLSPSATWVAVRHVAAAVPSTSTLSL
jgi:hypothetical protein